MEQYDNAYTYYQIEDSVAIVYEHNAQVNIEDENGAVYPLNERDNGNYISRYLSLNPATQYRIHIKTTDGKEYFLILPV